MRLVDRLLDSPHFGEVGPALLDAAGYVDVMA